MAVAPGVPKNACSFLLGRSCRIIRAERRFLSLVTYADAWANHDGHVYRACGWQEIGRQKGNDKWIEPQTGRQVSILSTKSRTHLEMVSAGFRRVGKYEKVKFVRYLHDDLVSKLLLLEAKVDRLTRVIYDRL
jgi:hypothetical protein